MTSDDQSTLPPGAEHADYVTDMDIRTLPETDFASSPTTTVEASIAESPDLSASFPIEASEESPVAPDRDATAFSGGTGAGDNPLPDELPELVPDDGPDHGDDDGDDSEEEQVPLFDTSTWSWHTPPSHFSTTEDTTHTEKKSSHDGNTLDDLTPPKKTVTFGEPRVLGFASKPCYGSLATAGWKDESVAAFRKKEDLPSTDAVPARSCLRKEPQVFTEFPPEDVPRPPTKRERLRSQSKRVILLPPPPSLAAKSTEDPNDTADEDSNSYSFSMPRLIPLSNKANWGQSCSGSSVDDDFLSRWSFGTPFVIAV